ncbi:MAG: hypothetical protein KAQ79_14990, partial [Cyclobacteriaceae bacterium]|nr:hypothetical protein [Cyclobacteriaceae bacterium]
TKFRINLFDIMLKEFWLNLILKCWRKFKKITFIITLSNPAYHRQVCNSFVELCDIAITQRATEKTQRSTEKKRLL